MKLHDETARRIEELFAEKSCHECRRPARRLRKERFYCEDCFPGRRRAEIRLPRLELPRQWRA